MAARSAVMVGRDVELGRLSDALTRAAGGQVQVAVVGGEAGIGKTRLVRELAERVPEGVVVAFGHAVPLTGGPLPYGVAGDLLRSLVREVHVKAAADALGPRAGVLAPLVPRLGDGTDAVLDRSALYAATQDLLAELSADQTLLLVIEDLHWADESSLDLVMFWARTLVRGRVLLVATSRDQGVDEKVLVRVAELRRLPNATLLDLSPLPAEGIEAQVRSLDETAEAELVAEIQRLSDGNPLFVEELVAGGAGGPSATLNLDLASSLNTVSPGASSLLQLAAVEPRSFTSQTLAAVAGQSLSVVEAALDEGSSRGLVRRDARGLWTFHHELLRQAVLAAGSSTFRDVSHRRWAAALSGESAGAGDLVSAADHWDAAVVAPEAFATHLRAARVLQERLGEYAAEHEWRRVLEMLQADASLGPESAYEDALLGAGGADLVWSEQMRIVEAEERTAGTPGPVRQVWTVLTRFCASRSIEGVSAPELSVEEVLRMREVLWAEPPRPAVQTTLYLLVRACNALGARDLRDETIDLLDQQSTTDPKALAVSTTRVMEWRLMAAEERHGDAGEDQRIIDKGLAHYDLLDSSQRAHVRMRLAELLQRKGELTGALGEVDEATRLLHSPEVGGFQWSVAESIAMGLLYVLGRWDEAARRAARVCADRDHVEAHNGAVAFTALIHAGRGDVEEALGAASLLMPVVMSGHDGTTGYLTRHYPVLIEAAARATGEPERARACLMPFLEDPAAEDHLLRQDFVVIAARLTALAERPDPDYAARVAAVADVIFDTDRLESAYRQHVDAYLAKADGQDSAEAWSDVVSEWETMSVPWNAADARLQLAHALVKDDERDRATEALAPALAAAEELGAQPLADEIRTFAARARLRLPGLSTAEAASTGGLTVRELEVLQLLAQGMTNDQIGTTLFMSPRTASVHVSRILAKLNAANRTEVAAIAHRRGLLD
jgi:DNA-binding CsgD family transcriptional regulator